MSFFICATYCTLSWKRIATKNSDDDCAAHGWPLYTYSAAQLQKAGGGFSASAFVERVTGVDNVCERSAVLAAGGPIRWKKDAGNGVTTAVALKPYRPDWRWRDE